MQEAKQSPRMRSGPWQARTYTNPLSMKSTWHVLVIEDDRPMQKLLQRELSSLGCQVDLAGDGTEGLALWERNDYDLVLTDFSLPGMDGSELASRIRRSGKSNARGIPLIAMTGYAEDVILRLKEAGVDDCLTKPFTSAELMRVLEPWISGSGATARLSATGDHAAAPDPLSDSAIRQHIAGIFVDTIPEYLLELRRACAAADTPGIRGAAHKLKSAARLVGGGEVADLCQSLEDAAGHVDATRLAEMAEPVPAALEALEESLRKSLRSDS